MIEQHYLELIHAEIDGELPERQRAELSAYLLANPAARAFRDDLRRVCDALDGIESVAPPQELRASILHAVGAPESPSRFSNRRALPRFPIAARFAAAIAAGVLVGVIAYQVGIESRGGPAMSELVGTMAGRADAPLAVLADTMKVDVAQVKGVVNLYRTGSVLIVEFDLAPQQPIEVVAAYDGREDRFSGLAAPGNAGEQRFAVSLAGAGEPGSAVGLKFYSAGVVIYEGALRITDSH